MSVSLKCSMGICQFPITFYQRTMGKFWYFLLWIIQCDHLIEARRPDLVVVIKGERKCIIIDIAVPNDSRTSDIEKQKMEKYQDLKMEIKRIWDMRNVIVVPVIVGALGSITKKLDE